MRRPITLLCAALAVSGLLAAPGTADAAPAHPAAPSHRITPEGASPARAARTLAMQSFRRSLAHALQTSSPAAPTGTVTVDVSGNPQAVAAVVHAAGGHVVRTKNGRAQAVIPAAATGRVANSPGVSSLHKVTRAFVDSTSEGVATSDAATWIAKGNPYDGTGTKIAIVDAGFGDLSNQVTQGNLPADQASRVFTEADCAQVSCLNSTQHGTAVAEIVHQMAPQAQLFLYAVYDSSDFNDAEQAIVSYNNANPSGKITIASSSLGFPLDGRGDGSGAPGSAAAAVKAGRQAGILWIQSAGNSAADHWGGNLVDNITVDSNGDATNVANGLVDMDAPWFENDVVAVAAGSSQTPADVQVALQWDDWPASKDGVTLVATGYQCTSAYTGDTSLGGCHGQALPSQQLAHVSGADPTLSLEFQNTASYEQIWFIWIKVPAHGYPTTRYDLTYYGDVAGPSANACPDVDAGGNCIVPTQASSGSIDAPANSPFAVAAGAADVGADGQPAGIEWYSSRGPTIDGRTKPELTGYDGTLTNLSEFSATNMRFYGTSAAAPHVAGAAALVQSLHPAWDASQIENFLEQRADGSGKGDGSGTPGTPLNPPVNSTGHGTLRLGDPTAVTLPAAGYYHVAPGLPARIYDSRNVGGVHKALGAGRSATFPVPGLPDGATAVAINLTGINASTTTYLSAYPGGTSFPGTSNLNLTKWDRTAAVFAIVSVTAAKTITVRNQAGTADIAVDEVGYFSPDPTTGSLFTAVSPLRIIDTRNGTGTAKGTVPPYGTVDVDPHLPSGATAAIVNITEVNSKRLGLFAAAPTCSRATSTLNFTTYVRANLAIVGLNSNGHFCVSNDISAADVLVDLVGYMGPSGSAYVGLPAPVRITDTRSGNGVKKAPIGQGGSVAQYGALVGAVPADASALLVDVVEASATWTSYLETFPGPTRPQADVSTLNFTPGRIVSNASVVGLSNRQFGEYNSLGKTQTATDLFGYFLPTS